MLAGEATGRTGTRRDDSVARLEDYDAMIDVDGNLADELADRVA